MTKISVIVPVYNASKYLEECLDSLIKQTFSDIEFIVIDDNSTDNSLDIIRDYASKYPQIKAYHNNQNYGQSITRNLGIDIAKGEYIGFVDSDDLVENTMYETMYKGDIDNNFTDVITSGIRFIKEDKVNPDFKSRWKGKLIDINKNPMEVFWESPSCCNKLFKRELIGNYRFLEKCTWEDVAFTYSMLMKSDTMLMFSDQFYLYRRDVTDGVSSRGYSVDSPLNDIFKVADEIEIQAQLNNKTQIFENVIPLLQIGVCFQRLTEINQWDIDEDIKNKKLFQFYQKVTEKYGDYKKLDDGLLSAKADLLLVDKIRNMNLEKGSFKSK